MTDQQFKKTEESIRLHKSRVGNSTTFQWKYQDGRVDGPIFHTLTKAIQYGELQHTPVTITKKKQ